MNTRLRTEKSVVLSRWIFSEAQTGKTRSDTHYSFLNNNFQAYVEDENDILIEDYSVKTIRFNGGIDGTTDVIVDAAALFGKISLKQLTSKSILAHRRPMKCAGWDILCT